MGAEKDDLGVIALEVFFLALHTGHLAGPFVDLIGGEGSSSGAEPSEVKEEPEEDEARLAWKFAWFIHGDAPQISFFIFS
jgi:hypothetical protein